MPRVPQYDGQQVRSAPLRGGMQGDLATGQIARSTQQLGGAIGALGEVAERAAVRDDADAAFRAETAIKSGWLQFDSELRKRSRGENAKGYVDEVDQWWSKAGEQHREALSPRAQALVSRSLSAMRQQSLASAMNFREGELDRAQVEAWQGAKETSISAAAADPATAGVGRATVLERNAQQAALKGWSREQLDAENLRDTTKLHLNVVNALLTDQPEAAKAYFDANIGEIDGSTHKNAIKFITDAVEDKQATARGTEIAAMPVDKQAAALAEIKDTTLQTKVRKVVREQLQDQEVASALSAKRTTKQAWAQLMERGSIGKIDPVLRNALRREAPEEERQMLDWAEARYRRAKSDAEGRKPEGDDETFYGLVRMATDPETAHAFADYDLMKAKPYLSTSNFNKLVTMQAGISRADAKAMGEAKVIGDTMKLLRGELAAAGIDTSPKEGSKEAKTFAAFMGALSSELMTAQATAKAPLKPEEARLIGMNLLRAQVEQGSGVFGLFANERRGFEIPADEQSKFVVKTYRDIPADARRVLDAEVMKRKGRSIYGAPDQLTTQEQAEVERAYTRGVRAGVFK